MKKILLLVLGLVAGSASFASTNDNTKLTAKTSVANEKVNLVIAPMNAKARLDLTDNEGHLLYSSNVNLKNGIKQVFDVSHLENGTYQLSLSAGDEHIVKTVDITESTSQQLITFQ